MDARADTLSGRFGGVWEFLSNPPQYGHTRSLPPSSGYLRSDQSNVSPLPTGLQYQQLNASRSSLPRNLNTPSIGGHSSTTIPSGPVLIPIHSADASAHSRPAPRSGSWFIMDREGNKKNELPPISEFGFQHILAAIEEEIESDINGISEILGRSRLVLADQHESQLPPQGEIRAINSPLQAVQEASSSNEHLAADDVMILREDASLVEGSHAGSAAYGLLERLQAMPRNRSMRSEVLPTSGTVRSMPNPRNNSSPAALTELPPPPEAYHDTLSRTSLRTSLDLLQNDKSNITDDAAAVSRITNSVVSETYLSAGADGRLMSDPPVVSESGKQYPLYSYDESELFETGSSAFPPPVTLTRRIQNMLLLRDLQRLPGRTQNRTSSNNSAEIHLRQILERNPKTSTLPATSTSVEDQEMYN